MLAADLIRVSSGCGRVLSSDKEDSNMRGEVSYQRVARCATTGTVVRPMQ